jgi:SAM-dependent methyltransferase
LNLTVKYKIANFAGNHLKQVKGGYFGRARFLLLALIYKVLPCLGFDYCRLIEWDFVLRNLPKGRLRVLDVGTTSSLFIYELAGRNYDTYAIDPRPYAERLPRRIKFFQYDIVATPFPEDFFDALTAISVIEHIGLGSYGDPKYNNGDFKAINEMKRILKDRGLLFITTLIANRFIITPDHNQRIYDKNRLASLTASFAIEKEEYYIFAKNRWHKTSRHVAFSRSPQNFALVSLMLRNRKS